MDRNTAKGGISRRRFIAQAAGLAASVSAASRAAAQKSSAFPKSGQTVGIGVIGGGFGTSFQWHEHPHCRVTAVCDLRSA